MLSLKLIGYKLISFFHLSYSQTQHNGSHCHVQCIYTGIFNENDNGSYGILMYLCRVTFLPYTLNVEIFSWE